MGLEHGVTKYANLIGPLRESISLLQHLENTYQGAFQPSGKEVGNARLLATIPFV